MPIDIDEFNKLAYPEKTILNFLRDNPRFGYSTNEIAKAVGIPLSKVYIAEGLLEQLRLIDKVEMVEYKGENYYRIKQKDDSWAVTI